PSPQRRTGNCKVDTLRNDFWGVRHSQWIEFCHSNPHDLTPSIHNRSAAVAWVNYCIQLKPVFPEHAAPRIKFALRCGQFQTKRRSQRKTKDVQVIKKLWRFRVANLQSLYVRHA